MKNTDGIYIINGANLKSLERREREHYGKLKIEELERKCRDFAQRESLEIVEFFSSNSEGEIIDKLHNLNSSLVIINPGAYAHYSYAIYDALLMLKTTESFLIEVHMSKVEQREDFRRKMVTGKAVDCIIDGFGYSSYLLALYAMKLRARELSSPATKGRNAHRVLDETTTFSP